MPERSDPLLVEIRAIRTMLLWIAVGISALVPVIAWSAYMISSHIDSLGR